MVKRKHFTKRVTVDLSKPEKDDLDRLVMKRDIALSDFLRTLIRQAIAQEKIPSQIRAS